MVNMVNIVTAKHQHVGTVIMPMLTLAISSKHCYAEVQPHKASSMAVLYSSCFILHPTLF